MSPVTVTLVGMVQTGAVSRTLGSSDLSGIISESLSLLRGASLFVIATGELGALETEGDIVVLKPNSNFSSPHFYNHAVDVLAIFFVCLPCFH